MTTDDEKRHHWRSTFQALVTRYPSVLVRFNAGVFGFLEKAELVWSHDYTDDFARLYISSPSRRAIRWVDCTGMVGIAKPQRAAAVTPPPRPQPLAPKPPARKRPYGMIRANARWGHAALVQGEWNGRS